MLESNMLTGIFFAQELSDTSNTDSLSISGISIDAFRDLKCVKMVGVWWWVERVAKTGATLELVRLVLRL